MKLFKFAIERVLDYFILKDKDFAESKAKLMSETELICGTTKHAAILMNKLIIF